MPLWSSVRRTLRALRRGLLNRLKRKPDGGLAIFHPESIACGLCDANTEPIGSAGQVVRVLTFGGGGFDTVVQLGATHAFVVSDAAPPDVVIGISVGAVQAAAMAEVLKADESVRKTSNSVALYREARMSRFREFLYECQEMPSRLRDSLLPDAYEADAGMALEPHHQASHEKKERDERQASLRARSGVVYLFNTLARLRITLATLTRFVRIYLGYRASSAYSAGRRWSTLASELTNLLRTVISHLASTLQLMVTLARAAVWGRWSGRLKGYAAGRIIFRETTKLLVLILAITAVAVAWALLRFCQAAAVAPVVSYSSPFLPRWMAPSIIDALSHLDWRVTTLLTVGAFLFAVAVPWVVLRIMYVVTFVAAALVWFVAPPLRNWISDGTMRRILDHFELGSDLGSAYFVRQTLVRLFDRDYYGKPDIRDFVVRALTRTNPAGKAIGARTLRDYTQGNRRIHVIPVAASLAEGELVPLAPDDKIVDGLEAATALLPFLRPVAIDTRKLIDGSSIANEPMAPARQLLRNRLHPDAGAVHIYPVSGLPVSRSELPRRRDENMTHDRPYTGLIDVVFRVRQLQSFRTAKLDREITELYARMIPPDRQPPELLRSFAPKGEIQPQPPRALRCFGKAKHFVRAEIHPIEPEKYAVTLSSRLFRSRTRLEEQQAVSETVATGCRMTLQSLCRDVVRRLASSDGTVDCATAMRTRLGPSAPTTGGETYPGAAEVCRHCHVVRDGKTLQQTLEVVQIGDEDPLQPVWPLDPLFHPTAVPAAITVEETKEERETPPREEPIAEATRNLLFSGGVFRGVFLVGVLNGLHQLRVKPTLLAGSSVGSITAAMAARVFSIAKDPKLSEKDRQTAAEKAVLDLAATYLVLDDLVVTDRFADFVRRFTLRAAEARFSPKDLDDVFRNYDRPGNRSFYNRSRRVVGGLEHLLYVSPFELLALLRSLRMQDARRSYRLIRRYFQEILDRGGVSLEVLGTEPLQVLIREHVLTAEQREQRSVSFDAFQNEAGMAFLATTTNITAGALEIIGAPGRNGVRRDATLVDALLASSAFPGVFRPRWGWEVYVGENEQHNQQLVDGGVMDNLPLDAVVTYLNEQAEADPPRIPIRPPDAPHLIFTGSLERDPRVLGKNEASRIAGSWPAALRHAREHAYNRKIDEFAKVQREFRQITQMYKNHATRQRWTPLDIEVIVAKPQWLCGTFAFHPMLGFRRDRQAASIAHGCATTLATFARYAVPGSVEKAHLDGWGIDEDVITDMIEETIGTSRQPRLVPKRRGHGICHFRNNMTCPFASPVGFEKSVAKELKTIYDLCGKRETHEAGK
jgi:predicted acylesterase/phospholipase RssA